MYPPIDPELREPLRQLATLSALLDDTSNMPRLRSLLLASSREAKIDARPISGVTRSVENIPVDGGTIQLWVYQPEASVGPMPALLWIHGGGFVLGSAEQDDLKARQLCADGQCLVVSVDYRLAPEHAYPTPLEDCYAALKWIWARADALLIDKNRIAVGGASAGGGLAAGLALLARDRNEVSLCFQLLLYPMLDNANVRDHERGDTPLWSHRHNRFGWESYLGDQVDSADVPAYAAPARAADLSGLPPAFIPIGEVDLFVEENGKYALRLQSAGVSAELHLYSGGFHAFEVFAPDAEVSKRMQRDIAAALKHAMHPKVST